MIQAAPRMKAPRAKATPREILAHLFMAAWLCVLLQGALRKWVFPGAPILYFVQDVPLLVAYGYALWKGLVWGGKLAGICVVLSLLVCIQTMAQLIFLDLKLRTAVIGLHHYIFYLPILFLAPVCYNARNRLRFVRWNLAIIIPMSLIAVVQSRSPKAAWINRTSAGADTGYGLATDVVRATGTFNFTLFYSIWCGMAVALVMGEWLLPPERRSFKSRMMLLVCSLSAVVATMVSGSRSAVMLGGLAFAGGVAAVVYMRNYRLMARFAAIVILLPVLTGIAYFAAPASFSAVIDRFSGEDTRQNLRSRIFYMFVGFITEARFSPLGVGVGFGIPAANPGGAASFSIVLSENEPTRIAEELGSFTGSAIVMLRFCAAIALVLASFRCLSLAPGRRFPHAVPLAFAAAPSIMIGELVRSAPLVATQSFFAVALILSAILFRREPLDSGPSRLPEVKLT
jgi:hypothetical protein